MGHRCSLQKYLPPRPTQVDRSRSSQESFYCTPSYIILNRLGQRLCDLESQEDILSMTAEW